MLPEFVRLSVSALQSGQQFDLGPLTNSRKGAHNRKDAVSGPWRGGFCFANNQPLSGTWETVKLLTHVLQIPRTLSKHESALCFLRVPSGLSFKVDCQRPRIDERNLTPWTTHPEHGKSEGCASIRHLTWSECSASSSFPVLNPYKPGGDSPNPGFWMR